MWEEFTQSIHTFTEDKKNLAQHTQGKKKATLIFCDPKSENLFGILKFSARVPKGRSSGDAYYHHGAHHDDIRGAKETIEATPPAKRAKAGKVAKKRTLKRSQQLVNEFVDEGIPLTEPGFGDLEADTQRAIVESLKDAHGAPRGPLPPVVFWETDTGKFQPLPKRRTSAPTEPSGHDESSSLYVELGLTESDMESNKEMPPVVKSGDQDEGQESQPLSTPGVHDGPNLEHTDAEATEATDATSQPQPGQMDEEFTTTAYPNVQENLKLTVDEPVIPEEPASSTGTLSSLQYLAKTSALTINSSMINPQKLIMRKTLQIRKLK
ncbi:hypothetical protein Tco_0796980 [Tanacetum coccineum]